MPTKKCRGRRESTDRLRRTWFRNTLHLAQSQNKDVDKAKFGNRMLAGRTANTQKLCQKKILCRLHEAMYIRVWASHEQYQGDPEKLINVLSFPTDAIVHCFSGKCGSTCDSQSFVWRGLPENCWPKEYLPPYALSTTDSVEIPLTGMKQTPKSPKLSRGVIQSPTQRVKHASPTLNRIYFSAVHRMNHDQGTSKGNFRKQTFDEDVIPISVAKAF